MTADEIARLRERVRTVLEKTRVSPGPREARVGIATGGTPRALARLLRERDTAAIPSADSPLELPLAALEELARELVGTTHDERLRLRGVRRRRADLLPTGAIVLCEVAKALDLEGFTICDWGLREGVLLESRARS